ncbi:MAG: Cna B-type domain-containing protein [Slackia sp.]|uniref:Cna B-type domain-containing protein n=1 Tax=uncultured Slackia sp. TaxID=665903 RepID=UPI002803B4A5|nr:Cna B-type domain-containing protein [uncultured Slackia sp.]MDU6011191.1 Cna B-type domain-containing protein [Slackia sp.]
MNNGAAVYGNDAQGAADDVAAVRMAGEEATTTISDRMLGGGVANWYKDGGILVPHVLGEPDPDALRSDPASSSNVPVSGISESTDIFALKATPAPAAIDLAQSKAKLTITNNSAARGGGIGSNGVSTLGKVNVHTKKVVVKKVWDTSANPDAAIPGSIKVWLLIDGKRIESVELTKDSGWTHTFEGLPLNADVSIEEDEAVEGWTAKVTSEEVSETEIAFTITNTPDAKSTSVSVKKVWDDADNKDESRPASVKVQLYANGEAYGDPVVLNSDSNWAYTWTGLPVMKDGSAVEYTVAEVDAPKGYKARIAGSASEGFTITNVKEPTKPPAKEQPKKPRISKIPATGDDLGAMTFALAGVSVASIACIAAARRKMRG